MSIFYLALNEFAQLIIRYLYLKLKQYNEEESYVGYDKLEKYKVMFRKLR